MMDNNSDSTTQSSGHTLPDDAQDNKLGLVNIDDIYYMEAMGISEANVYMMELSDDIDINIYLLKDLHKKAFGRLYHWAGKIRTSVTNIGVPPYQIYDKLKLFLDNVQYRLHKIDIENIDEVIDLLAYVHHTVVYIHPFVNGNGRISRLFTNLISLKLTYPPFEIYVRDITEVRKIYIDAIKKADKGYFDELKKLIKFSLEYSINQYEEMNIISV